jgi:SAM-dependent methyltransferase
MTSPANQQNASSKSLGNVDLDWAPEPLWENWPRGPDNSFALVRMEEVFGEKATEGTPGRVLDLACGQAQHAPALHRHGWDVLALEPSPAMITKARATAKEAGMRLELFKAIGEVVPFRDSSFDRVLCQSSLDHFANPEKGLREIARILKPGGLAVIGLVNYGGISCRGSRAVYRIGRALGLMKSNKFWDTPVPHEHTFETTLFRLKQMGEPWLDLEGVSGTSMLWAFPGWGSFLNLMPGRIARVMLRSLDVVARRMPTASDFLVTVWRARA